MRTRYRAAWLPALAICFAIAGQAQGEAETTAIALDGGANTIALRHPGGALNVSILAPTVMLEGYASLGGVPPENIEGTLSSGQPVVVSYPPLPLADGASLEVKAFFQWHSQESLLRKWAQLKVHGNSPCRVNEVVLENLPLEGRAVRLDATPPQSYPAMLPGFFAGIEFPVATTRVEGDNLLLAHAPGVTLEEGALYTTRTAVYALAPAGRESQTFKDYIARNRPTPTGLHVNYNSWWTSSVPFTEAEILGIMKSFDDRLTRPHGVALDTFTIDLGWSDDQTLWDISRERFPEGFTNIQQATERMDSHLGLWISPSSMYPGALDTEWAKENGYETVVIQGYSGALRIGCLGGTRYATAFRERLVDFITRYGLRHVKLDGYTLTCEETGHGHAPGALSSEAIAEGGIAAFDAMHAASPDVWLEATCFGWNPSPWWLFHVNSVIGTYGDDAPHGRVPAPVYRESYTTARDFFNLQGAAHLNIPSVAQEVLGIIHQTGDDFVNDAVDVILRGHAFLTMYVNPKFMDDRRWRALAGCIDWARNNPVLFQHSEPILPASWQDGKAPLFINDATMPREPYGYVHWNGTQGLVGLRNPWIAPATIAVKLGGHDGLANAPHGLSAVSLYPEVRVYGTDLAQGDILNVPLAPYETVVLSVASGQRLEGLPNALEAIGSGIQATPRKSNAIRVVYEHEGETMGPDWTARVTPGGEAIVSDLEAELVVEAPRTRLLILLEGSATPSWPSHLVCTLDDNDLPLRRASSNAGWSASVIPPDSERWQFIEGDISEGTHRLSLNMASRTDCTRVSVWLHATRAGGTGTDYPNALPAPEIVSLHAVTLFESGDIASLPPPESRPVEIDRIDGVYLDALAPASATQEYGTLQTNRSITETPLNIGGRQFQRGLGTHSNSRVVYELGGAYTRFQAYAGGQNGSQATITFEVWVDGKPVWESGLMAATDDAKAVDVDVTGAQRLELVVGDGGNGFGADHADWCDAKLLR